MRAIAVMDADLQIRFWRNFTDAMFHSTDAALAAAAAWQNEFLAESQKKSRPASLPSVLPTANWPWPYSAMQSQFQPQARKPDAAAWPMMWWFMPPQPAAPANPYLASFAPSVPNTQYANALAPMTSMMSAMTPWAEMYWRTFAMFSPQSPAAQMAKTFAPYFPWPALTWSYMQTPLTAMLMSSGMPYAVASPSAKASTCAMDAADAAREQMEKVYASYRSDGGHAAAQLVTLPWSLAATFLSGSKTNTPSAMQMQ